RHYTTHPEDLWDAITNPHRIVRWFLPITGDLKQNGHYKFEGHAGGKIIDCVAPKKMELTWEYGDNVSWIRINLQAEGDGTRLTLEHLMPKDAQAEDHWKSYGPGATGVGWELAFLALDYHLSNNATIDPEENEAWLVSDRGKQFVRECAKQWGEAHIASGEASDTALTMAQMTAKFYTGE
ncbi:MAG: SRPBCC family protein, partial [Pseudomonadota bacterium]